MPVFSVLALSLADDGNIRVILLILILVAVALILGGCTIALLTLKHQREYEMVHSDRKFRE